MEIPSGKWSIGALMRVIVPIAIQLVLFQGVAGIVLLPPVTITLLILNIALVFVLVRPSSWEPRILGMLLGGLVGIFALFAFYVWEYQDTPHVPLGTIVKGRLSAWASSMTDTAGAPASALRFINQYGFEIAVLLLDALGLASIWAGGWLDRHCRRRWAEYRASRAPAPRDHALTS